MRAGQLDQYVQLQRRTFTENEEADGGATETWNTYASVWVQIAPGGGTEGKPANMPQVESTGTLVMTMYRRGDMLPSDRVLWGTVALNVVFVRPNSTRSLYMEVELEVGRIT